jgi:hypothetical protein
MITYKFVYACIFNDAQFSAFSIKHLKELKRQKSVLLMVLIWKKKTLIKVAHLARNKAKDTGQNFSLTKFVHSPICVSVNQETRDTQKAHAL